MKLPSFDPYDVIGVKRNATAGEIKSAYRRQARRFHPDAAHPLYRKEATICFQQIGEAYDCLTDPEKRRIFDSLSYTMHFEPSALDEFRKTSELDDTSRRNVTSYSISKKLFRTITTPKIFFYNIK